MTTERYNATKHISYAHKTGYAGGCTSNAQSGLPERQLWIFSIITVSAGFVLNEIWEMAQMSAYAETAGRSWLSTLGLCTRATVGDLEIILGIYAAGALSAGDIFWGLHARWNNYVTTAVLGLAYAAMVEHAALSSGRWSYSESMPVVPWFGAGLWPLLQMTILPPLTFWIARWWIDRRTTKGAL